ncbi:NAD(P)-dependent dehydrogenase (short-subunit alcohol dehydrogenase family) [Mycobacterium sp. MAA66]|uniref:SDR family NAD(P)-dependent oxidoreductase n=1 Tax=Mycobacterium sp. MAA66 TaxID=3156297 RepID=UPI00351467D3
MKKSIVAVVLDAGSDNGLATALSLLAHGYRVVVTDRHAGSLVRITHGQPADRIYAIAADTHDRAQLDQLLARVRARFGRVDMIVNPDLYSAVMPLSA